MSYQVLNYIGNDVYVEQSRKWKPRWEKNEARTKFEVEAKKKKKVIKKNNVNIIFQNSKIMPKILSKSLLVVFHFASGSYMTQYGSDGKYDKSRKPEGKWVIIHFHGIEY